MTEVMGVFLGFVFVIAGGSIWWCVRDENRERREARDPWWEDEG
jgi:hypothetical protein